MADARGTINGHLIYRWLVRIVSADKERFITRLSARIVSEGDCLLFTTEGGKTRKGYRRLSAGIDGRLVKFYAHHVFWTLANKQTTDCYRHGDRSHLPQLDMRQSGTSARSDAAGKHEVQKPWLSLAFNPLHGLLPAN